MTRRGSHDAARSGRGGCPGGRPAPGRVEHTLEERELAEAIDRFLRTLPERECSMFLRRYWYVDSVQSIAARYAIKENTAKSILFRTREKLRRYLAGEGIIV